MADRIGTHFHMIPPFWAEAFEAKMGKPLWGTPGWSPDELSRRWTCSAPVWG